MAFASPPLVSIIIPTYKRPMFLGRSIGSVLNQSYSHWEIVVVDDNDPQSSGRAETEAFMAKYADEARIRYVTHAYNQGGAAARNSGIKQSQGEYVAFLDDDDEWLPSKLEQQLAAFEASAECILVYTGHEKVHEGDKPDEVALPTLRGDLLEELLCYNSVGTTSTILCKREALLKVGLFDASLPASQDYDLYVRLAQLGTFEYVNKVLTLFHRHAGDTITGNTRARVAAFDLFQQKHAALFRQYPEAYRCHLKAFGRDFLTMGEVQKASEIFRTALKLSPFDPKVWAYLALASMGKGATRSVQQTRKAVLRSLKRQGG